MRILGIDPGIGATGYGIIEARKHGEWGLLTFGEIRTVASDPFHKRLKSIFNGLRQVIALHHPTEAALEATFLANNVQSALKLGQAKGVALLAAEMEAIPIFEYSPTAVKMAVVGYGRATKNQVQQMVSRLLSHTEVITAEHAADALAIALCHAHSRISQARLRG
jgi:crossover junction endodeoxyribonuclease RuvC